MQVSWGIKELLSYAWHALLRPHKVFRNIDPLAIRYPSVLTFLFIVGAVWINLHGYLLFTKPIWSSFSNFVLYSLTFGTIAIVNWLFLAIFLWSLQPVFEGVKKLSLAQVEKGAFALTMTWVSLPLLDIPHLWFSQIPVVLPVLGYHTLHFSHIFAGVVIPIQMYFLLRAVFPSRGSRFAVLFALIALPVAKFVFEDLVFLAEEFVFSLGLIGGKYYDAVSLTLGQYIAIPAYILWRLVALKYPLRDTVINVIVPTGLFIAFTLPFILGQDPLYPEYASDAGYVDSSMDDGRVGEFVYLDSIEFPFDPQLDPISKFDCNVHFLSETIDATPNDGFPRARCEIAPTDSYSIIGDWWSDLSGEENRETSWEEQEDISQFQEKGNDIRIIIETSPGDIVSFSGVFVGIE
ncbi:MAG: hypothetical protein O2794_01525 [bacterium]|nr:hypothetical protein [bacterium]